MNKKSILTRDQIQKSFQKIKTLEADEAISLWQRGKESWNKWVDENPNYNISFKSVNFEQFRSENKPEISFEGFRFPKGVVNFRGVIFGNGSVNFSRVEFDDGDVSFSRASFGDGYINFSSTTFGNGNVSFSQSIFGNGCLCFAMAKFGNGEVSFERCELDKIIFSKVKFGIGPVNFNHATFRDGNADFSKTTFSDGDVTFVAATFGAGYLNFSGAIFGDGDVHFREVNFSNGDVNFEDVKFGIGNVSFINCTFGNGDVKFDNTTFGEGYVNFDKTQFGDGEISFYKSNFSNGLVSFYNVKLGNGLVNFEKATFGEGGVNFYEASFGNCNVKFNGAKFGDGDINFLNNSFGCCNVSFDKVNVGDGDFNFKDATFETLIVSFENALCKARFNIENINPINGLNFRGATFGNVVSIKNVHVKGLVDLVNTKLTNQLSLHGFTCELNRKTNRFLVKVISDIRDIERANRAKELAEANKHYALALRFHADEMRAKRWQPNTRFLSSFLDLAFDKLCNYGQSVSRPLVVWVISLFGFTGPYSILSKQNDDIFSKLCDLFTFSLSNSLPFLTSSSIARSESLKKVFVESEMTSVLLIMMLQGVISVVLLFLIGLGLRNRFRL